MAVSNRVRAAFTTTVLATAATGFMAAAVPGARTRRSRSRTRTDENGEIVDDEYCDDNYSGGGGGLFFLYLGGFGRGLPVGTCRPAVPGSIRATRRRARPPGCPAPAVSGGTRGAVGSARIGGRSGTAGG